MQLATRYALWLAAALVLGAALISALLQTAGSAPVDVVFMCSLALAGLGLGFLGTLFGAPTSGTTCEGEGDGHAQDPQGDQAQVD